MANPFKPGDKVICIKKPIEGSYQCDVGAIATVSYIIDNFIHTEEDICTSTEWCNEVCYRTYNFKLAQRKISLKHVMCL